MANGHPVTLSETLTEANYGNSVTNRIFLSIEYISNNVNISVLVRATMSFVCRDLLEAMFLVK